MARRYWVKVDGRKLYRATLGAAMAYGQRMADELRRDIVLGFDELEPPKVLRRNPDPGSYLSFWHESEKARAARLKYLDATKARRLAKGLRGANRGGAVKAAEAGAQKTAKFAVDVRNAKEAYTIFRPSRAAAEAVQAQFSAAGYKTTLRAV